MIDPCGMIVDLLRRPYRQKVRFFSNLNREDTIRWYQCKPEAKPLPFNTVFSSAVWDDMNPPTPPALWTGELKLPPDYAAWAFPGAGPGQTYQGTPAAFQGALTLADLQAATPQQCCGPRGTPARTWSRVLTAWPYPPNTAWEWSKVGADVRYQPAAIGVGEYSAVNAVVEFFDYASYVSILGEFSKVVSIIDGPIWWLRPEQMLSYSVGSEVSYWPSFSLPNDPATQSDPTQQPGVGLPLALSGLYGTDFARGDNLSADETVVCAQGFSVYLIWEPPVTSISPPQFSEDGPGLLWSGSGSGFSIFTHKNLISVTTDLWTHTQSYTQNLSYLQLTVIRYDLVAGTLTFGYQGTTIAVLSVATGAILTVEGLANFAFVGVKGGTIWYETIVYSYCLTNAQDAQVYSYLQPRYPLP